ncbi:MAG: membrane-bound lytic murein transglycosylase D [Paraglaciecola sp.]|jgi:membrane-bound lytic murein transglycosylase D
MSKNIQLYTFILATFLTVAIFASNINDSISPVENIIKIQGNGLPQVVKGPNLDRPFDFADEELPMDNFDVRERLDRELLVNSYWQSSTLLNIKASKRYFPLFEKVFEEYGIPDDFKYISVAESSLRNVTSPAGAKGFWQFMKSVGQSFDLEVNSEVDERFNIEKATHAAAKHFLGLYKRFGSWTLAATAYNVGPTKLKRQKEEQRANTYYDMNLNQETSRYIFRLVAIKEILKDPSAFGFQLEDTDYYQPITEYAVVETNESIPNLGDFAKKYGTTYRMLKVYNPWLISGKLTNSKKKTYQIKVPK